MPIDVTQHPDFGVKQAKYNTDKGAAVAQGDAVAQARAEADWQGALGAMTADLYQRQDAAREREATIARIRAENPAAPPEIFEIGDVAQMERAAKAVQATAAAVTPHARQVGSWSPPPGGGSTAPPSGEMTLEEIAASEQRIFASQSEAISGAGHYPSVLKKMDKIAPEVMTKGRLALDKNEELQDLSLEPLMTRFSRSSQPQR